MFSSLLDNFISLFYPQLCPACNKDLAPGEEMLCLDCEFRLPKTEHHLELENAMSEKFWGRVSISYAAGMYHFVKGGRVQALIHHLKYKGKTDVGIWLGEKYGRWLMESRFFREVDYIIPVPLHPKKEFQRGYNQSDVFAKGLSASMNIPWRKDILKRSIYTETQTKKTREERFDNVSQAFVLGENPPANKHFLLVDDVMTTGATLEACAHHLLKIPGAKVSLAVIGFAN